jgi:phosphoglycolate phosphatase-like HAD superfamily hydrolase
MLISKKAFIDFDGTIVYIYKRYFHILNDYLKNIHNVTLNYDEYVKFKINRYKDHEIVKKTLDINISIENYHYFKLENIESPIYLQFDEVIPFTVEALLLLKEKGFFIELLSYRLCIDSLVKQLFDLNLYSLFDRITVITPSKEVNEKSNYIKDNKISNHDIIIGDSPSEIEAANNNNINGKFVESGLFTKDYVKNCDFYNNLYDAVKSIE